MELFFLSRVGFRQLPDSDRSAQNSRARSSWRSEADEGLLSMHREGFHFAKASSGRGPFAIRDERPWLDTNWLVSSSSAIGVARPARAVRHVLGSHECGGGMARRAGPSITIPNDRRTTSNRSTGLRQSIRSQQNRQSVILNPYPLAKGRAPSRFQACLCIPF